MTVGLIYVLYAGTWTLWMVVLMQTVSNPSFGGILGLRRVQLDLDWSSYP